MSKSLKGASDLLQSEADRYLIHHDMRAAIWTETSALSTLLQLPFTASEKHSMFHKWSQDKGGFMYQLMSIASMRPALHDYISTKAIDNYTMVVVEGRETGYLDFCAKGKVLNFIQEWRCGVAIDNIIKVFLTDNMDDLADWAIKEIRTSLDGLRLDPGLGDALEACSVGMGDIMTKSVVDDLAKRIATFDPFISDCAGLADNLGIKASVVLQPFRDIQLAGYEISFNCTLVFDDEPVPLSDFVPLLERCAHIADLIAIASFFGAHLLADKSKWIIPRSGHSRERASVPVLVAPILHAGMRAVQAATGLAWTQHVETTSAFENRYKMRYPTAAMNKYAEHISGKWLAQVRASVSDTVILELQTTTEALKAKTPSYWHIITHSSYNSMLAKRQLLNNGSLHIVAELIDDAASLRDALNLFCYSERRPDCPIIMECDGVMILAKSALAIIAAVGLVEAPLGAPDVPQMAAKILEDRVVHIPESLKVKLKALAS